MDDIPVTNEQCKQIVEDIEAVVTKITGKRRPVVFSIKFEQGSLTASNNRAWKQLLTQAFMDTVVGPDKLQSIEEHEQDAKGQSESQSFGS